MTRKEVIERFTASIDKTIEEICPHVPDCKKLYHILYVPKRLKLSSLDRYGKIVKSEQYEYHLLTYYGPYIFMLSSAPHQKFLKIRGGSGLAGVNCVLAGYGMLLLYWAAGTEFEVDI